MSICGVRDLEAILAERAREIGVEVRYATSLAALEDRSDVVSRAHSKTAAKTTSRWSSAPTACIRACANSIFGPERQFDKFLGLYVAAFHVARGNLPFDRKVKLYQETDRMMFLYPLDEQRLDATYVFRHAEMQVAKDRAL